MAQDIYTSGCFINPSGQKVAAVFKNDVIIYRRDGEGKDLYSSSMAIDTLTDDIYWVSNSNPVGDIANGYGCVMKNDEVLLDNELGTCINSISFDGNDLYAAGFYMTVTVEEGNEIDVIDLPAGLYLVHCGNRVLRFVKDYPHY